MNIWLIQIGEPLPIDNKGRDRLYRTGLLAKYLTEAEHSVLWWTSDFYHQQKRIRFGKDESIKLENGMELRLLHTIPYYKNISFRRIINHFHLAKIFWREANRISSPDIILSSYPSIELCKEAVKYGIKKRVPVVVDIRDLWPDIFTDIVTDKRVKKIIRFLCIPYFHSAKFVFKNAYAITGTTEEYISWGLKYADRIQTELDRAFPFAYPELSPTEHEIKLAEQRWKQKGLDKNRFIICFFGTLGWQFDYIPILDAANRLKNTNVLFVICGSGDYLKKVKQKARLYKNIIFPGWVSEIEIWLLMRYAKIGLAPYTINKNFLFNLTNKPVEYLSAGLPVLSSINGVLGSLLRTNKCGMVYGTSGKKLAEFVTELKTNVTLYENMSRNAQKLFTEKFSTSTVYPKMIKYLEEIILKFRKYKLC